MDKQVFKYCIKHPLRCIRDTCSKWWRRQKKPNPKNTATKVYPDVDTVAYRIRIFLYYLELFGNKHPTLLATIAIIISIIALFN